MKNLQCVNLFSCKVHDTTVFRLVPRRAAYAGNGSVNQNSMERS